MGNDCCGARDTSTEDSGKLYNKIDNPKDVQKFKKEIEKQFQSADKDSSKSLSFEELYRMTVNTNLRLGLPAPKKEDIRRLFKEGDVNGDGKLSLEEYTDLMLNHLKELAALQRALDQKNQKSN